MRYAVAQFNPIVGDVEGNAQKMAHFAQRAQAADADLVIFPELCILGYPPKDLLLDTTLLKRQDRALGILARHSNGIALVAGIAVKNPGPGKPLFNAAALISNGRVKILHRKNLLPYYDVFDEARYFAAGSGLGAFTFKGIRITVSICEDIWNDKNYWESRQYAHDPLCGLKAGKPDLLINIAASPFWRGKQEQRHDMVRAIAKRYRVPVVYANMVGGNDELVFDGGSFAMDAQGRLLAQAASFKEDLIVVNSCHSGTRRRRVSGIQTLGLDSGFRRNDGIGKTSDDAQTYQALTLGLRDYTGKCGFNKVILGLSGGIDSALVACLAADALGAKNVLALAMPSRYSSGHSKQDAQALAANLDIDYKEISIEPIFTAYLKLFQDLFPGVAPNIAEENIQARIRGSILMAHSNKFGHLLLATGNKSEMAMGYCTLYGDMMGGLAPISDLTKTQVYALAKLKDDVIPQHTFTKAPSAELKPDQKDQDTLPPYDILDRVLESYIVAGKPADKIARRFGKDLASRVLRSVDANEFKRRQAPPGLKVSKKAFGFGWRMPIARKLGR
ncbi:MAG: NAD+ synthase [Elusimicrobiota bacterium]